MWGRLYSISKTRYQNNQYSKIIFKIKIRKGSIFKVLYLAKKDKISFKAFVKYLKVLNSESFKLLVYYYFRSDDETPKVDSMKSCTVQFIVLIHFLTALSCYREI